MPVLRRATPAPSGYHKWHTVVAVFSAGFCYLRIANANVSVLEGDKEIAVQETDDHGKFSFDQLKPGNYELRIRVHGIPDIAGTRVVLARPNAKSKKEIAVNISVTVAN